MRVLKCVAQVAVVLAALSVSASAFAQATYRCSNGSQTYYSDRPCKHEMGSIGPAPGYREPAQPQQTYIPPVGKAPDYLQYLSANCATLNDAVRTGPARGLKSQAMSDLHNEYRAKCAEEDADARRQVQQDRRAQGNERRAQQMTQQAEQQRVVTSREQCNELLRILASKRQKLDTMNAGERADHERFEANYNARCKS
jgi:hypothetical protein